MAGPGGEPPRWRLAGRGALEPGVYPAPKHFGRVQPADYGRLLPVACCHALQPASGTRIQSRDGLVPKMYQRPCPALSKPIPSAQVFLGLRDAAIRKRGRLTLPAEYRIINTVHSKK